MESDVGIMLTWNFKNGMEVSSAQNLNVETGAGGGAGLFIACGLVAGDRVYDLCDTPTNNCLYAAELNSTTTRAYLGASREVNLLDRVFYGTHYVFYWDKTSGFLLEESFASSYTVGPYTFSFSVFVGLTETNLWSPVFSLAALVREKTSWTHHLDLNKQSQQTWTLKLRNLGDSAVTVFVRIEILTGSGTPLVLETSRLTIA